jgi:hypothetical protein
MPPRHSSPAIIALVPTQYSERTPMRVESPADAWLALEEFTRHLRQFHGRPGWQLN